MCQPSHTYPADLRLIAFCGDAILPQFVERPLIRPQAEQENQLRKDWLPPGRFVVCYAGNLGRAHDIETVLSAMTLLLTARWLRKRKVNSPVPQSRLPR